MTQPYPFQIKDVRQMHRMRGRLLLSWEMGLGKAQPLDAKILTPTGWTSMSSVAVGDDVIGSDGNTTRITAIFPQGFQKVYRLTFRDGSHAESTYDHLWQVNTPVRKQRGSQGMVLPLAEIRRKLFDSAGNCRYFIPVVKMVQFAGSPTPLDPYLLGYLIANGSLTQHPSISIPDEETAERLQKILPEGIQLRRAPGKIHYGLSKTNKKGGEVNPLKVVLRDLGLLGKYSYQKFIPPCYRYNSVEIRVAVLQGLMDGDGWVSKKDGITEYTTTSKKLAWQVRGLIWSLGGTCTLRSKIPSFTYKGIKKKGRRAYTICLALPDNIIPFRLNRKAAIYRPRQKYLPTRAITKIEYMGYRKCQCIQIEAKDGLYVTNNYVLTHNTYGSLLYASRHPHLRPIVVVCGASLKWQWANECRNHFGWGSTVLEGTKQDKKPRGKIIIVNYDVLPAWLDTLAAVNPQLIIADEVGSYLANFNSRRTWAVRMLCQGVPHVIALSGTPLTNRPKDLFPTLNIIDPETFSDPYPFYHKFCGPKRVHWGNGWSFTGATNIAELHSLLANKMIRRRTQDVLPDLPARRRIIVPLEISDRKQYTHAENDFLGWLKTVDPTRVSKAQRAELLARTGYLKRLAATLKLPSVCAWVDSFLSECDDKLVLFALHKNVLGELNARYGRTGVYIDGSTPERKRQWAVNQFQTHAATRVFIIQMKAGGTGLNLTAGHNVAFPELDWVPATHLQCEKRCNRIGSTHPLSAYYLVAHRTLEEHLLSVLESKQKICNRIVEGKIGKVDTLDVYSQLCDRLQKGKQP